MLLGADLDAGTEKDPKPCVEVLVTGPSQCMCFRDEEGSQYNGRNC